MANVRPVKVIFLTFHFPLPEEPGAFRPWVEAQLLRDIGCQVTVITSCIQYLTGEDIREGSKWCEEQWRDGIRILRVWAPKSYRRHLRSRLINYAVFGVGGLVAGLRHGGKADIVFTGTDPVSAGPAAFLLSRLRRARLILDERDLYPETAIALGVLKEGWFSRFVFSLQEFWRHRADGILVATPGIARTLRGYGHPSGKIDVIMNADPFIDSNGDTADRHDEDLRKIVGRRFVVAYAGGLGLANDIGTLIEAADLLRDEDDIGFAIIGEGERRIAYGERCRDLGLKGIHMLRARPRNTARRMLRSADVCIHLYSPDKLFQGALASKVFDYLAVGKPIVFAGSGDTADLLERAGAAIVVPSADAPAVALAIRKLHEDPDLCRRLGAAGKQWYQDNVSLTAVRDTVRRVFDLGQPITVQSTGL